MEMGGNLVLARLPGACQAGAVQRALQVLSCVTAIAAAARSRALQGQACNLQLGAGAPAACIALCPLLLDAGYSRLGVAAYALPSWQGVCMPCGRGEYAVLFAPAGLLVPAAASQWRGAIQGA